MNDLLLVPAGAGAGKTHKIKTTLTDWVRSGIVRPERILAVTFTEAAASELRQRIRSSLLEAGLVEGALAVDRAYVSTIHALGLRVLTEHAFANGSSPLPRLLSDDERDLLLRLEVARCEPLELVGQDLARYGYVSSGYDDTTPEDRFRGQVFSTINLLRNLGDRGRSTDLAELATQAIRATYGPPSGDGKTLGDQLHAAVNALLTAFPASLASTTEYKTVKEQFESDHRTLRRAGGDRDILDGDWRLWASLRKLRRSKKGSPTPAGYDDLADAVIAAADRLVNHPGPLEDACNHVTALIEGCQAILAGYEERKRGLGVIDYADMVTNAERLLRTDEGVLGAVLGEIDCVIVDEFQDTNPIQFAFLWQLAKLAPRTLLVGDVKQAIMGFQGADARLTESLVDANPDNVSPLDRNWRSDPRIMEFVNALGPLLFPDAYLPLAPVREADEETALEVLAIAKGRGGKPPAPPHHIAARLFNLIHDDGAEITDRHTGRSRRIEPRDIAILCPTHSMAKRYAAALRELGLPVRVTETGWLSSPVVTAARYALAISDDSFDRHSVLCFSVLGPPQLSLQDALASLVEGTLFDASFLDPIKALNRSAKIMPLPVLLNRVIEAANLRDWADLHEDLKQARADLLRLEAEAQAFVEAHRDMKAAAGFHGSSVRVFLGWLQARLADPDFDRRPDPSAGSSDGIEIVTWHSAKGREWPVVVAAGLDYNFTPRPFALSTGFPDFQNLDSVLERASVRFCPSFAAQETQDRFLAELMPEAERTARRLLYVVLTRARDRLILEWPLFDIEKLGKDEKGIATHARLLASECSLSVGAGELFVGDESFPARTSHCLAEMPPEFDEAVKRTPVERGYRFGRNAVIPAAPLDPGAPWLILPSSLETSMEPVPADIATTVIGETYDVPKELFSLSTERGTALHQALRVLMQRPELKPRLADHTGLDAATLDLVERQASALTVHLETLGYTHISHEVPLVYVDANGSTVSAVVDCLAEGPDGLAIIDHKSDPVDDPQNRFAVYWPQLAAYVGAARQVWPEKPIREAGIHWMTRGVISMCGPP